jgi:hypothetical protein
MNTTANSAAPPRGVYCVLGARSLPYAELAFESLVRHSREKMSVTLITDGADDKKAIEDVLAKLGGGALKNWRVCDQAETDGRALDMYASYPHLAAFRRGHPCWRKITDPLLFAPPGEEIVLLDPDLYFPNFFTFERTPTQSLLLMWQRPHCLLPDETVAAAYRAGVKLAHHTDIGVAQFHNRLELEWLDWLIGQLGGSDLPRKMHVESIVWAALAMRIRGGYLNPRHWHCWRNTPFKRVALRFAFPGPQLLRFEAFRTIKCFHGGGVAKWWLREARERGYFGAPTELVSESSCRPFEELTQRTYQRGQRLKRLARRLGFYALFQPKG